MSPAAPLAARKKRQSATILVPYWLREFALVRLAVVSLAGALGIGAAGIFASNWYLRDATENRRQAQQSRDQSYARFAQVENEKQEIRTFQPQYIIARDKGLIGEENRLNWVDQIRQIQEQRRLPPLTYEIEPQQSVRLAGRLPLGGYVLRTSRMSLHMDLMHEGDLFNFLEDLRQRSYFAVQECSMKRTGGAQNIPNAPTLAADCKLNWLTMIPAVDVNAGVHKRGKR